MRALSSRAHNALQTHHRKTGRPGGARALRGDDGGSGFRTGWAVRAKGEALSCGRVELEALELVLPLATRALPGRMGVVVFLLLFDELATPTVRADAGRRISGDAPGEDARAPRTGASRSTSCAGVMLDTDGAIGAAELFFCACL